MFKSEDIKQSLLGSLEIALFMRGGASRFQSDPTSMKKSFLIPILLLPLTLAMVLGANPHALNYSLRLFVYLGAFLGFVYYMARTMDKLDDFHRFATANNWLTIPAAALMVIPVSLFFNGIYTWQEIYPAVVLITLYSYAYTAFMAARVMRIPIEMASFIAITGLIINHNALGFLKWAAVSTLNFLA
jgi:hypothetical protein